MVDVALRLLETKLLETARSIVTIQPSLHTCSSSFNTFLSHLFQIYIFLLTFEFGILFSIGKQNQHDCVSPNNLNFQLIKYCRYKYISQVLTNVLIYLGN